MRHIVKSIRLLDAFAEWERVVVAPAGTIERYRRGILEVDAFGLRSLRDVTRESVARFQFDRRRRGAAARTVNVDVAGLLTLLRWLEPRGLVKLSNIDAISRLKLPVRESPPPTFYARDEYDRLRSRAHEVRPWLGFALDVLTFTGVRISEGVRIVREDLDLGDRPILRVSRVNGDTKTHRERVVPLCPEIAATLRAQAPAAGAIFPSCQRSRSRYTTALHITSRTVQEAVAELGCLVGIKATPHKSRRTFTTWALKVGVPAPTVARWLGHSDLTMLYRHYYAHIPAYDAAIERLGKGAP